MALSVTWNLRMVSTRLAVKGQVRGKEVVEAEREHKHMIQDLATQDQDSRTTTPTMMQMMQDVVERNRLIETTGNLSSVGAILSVKMTGLDPICFQIQIILQATLMVVVVVLRPHHLHQAGGAIHLLDQGTAMITGALIVMASMVHRRLKPMSVQI